MKKAHILKAIIPNTIQSFDSCLDKGVHVL